MAGRKEEIRGIFWYPLAEEKLPSGEKVGQVMKYFGRMMNRISRRDVVLSNDAPFVPGIRIETGDGRGSSLPLKDRESEFFYNYRPMDKGEHPDGFVLGVPLTEQEFETARRAIDRCARLMDDVRRLLGDTV